MRKRILMYQGDINELAKHFSVSRQMVHGALTYKYNSRMAIEIRKEAMKRDGMLVKQLKDGGYEEIEDSI